MIDGERGVWRVLLPLNNKVSYLSHPGSSLHLLL